MYQIVLDEGESGDSLGRQPVQTHRSLCLRDSKEAGVAGEEGAQGRVVEGSQSQEAGHTECREKQVNTRNKGCEKEEILLRLTQCLGCLTL